MILIKMNIPKSVFFSLYSRAKTKRHDTPEWMFAYRECRKVRLNLLAGMMKKNFQDIYEIDRQVPLL